jgi:hypothetical protein
VGEGHGNFRIAVIIAQRASDGDVRGFHMAAW